MLATWSNKNHVNLSAYEKDREIFSCMPKTAHKEDYQSIYANPQAIPYLDKIKTISKFNWNLYEVVYTSD